MKRDLALASAGIIAICVITFALRPESQRQPALKTGLSAAAQKEIAGVEAEIDEIEAETLAPLPGKHSLYAGWGTLVDGLKTLLGGARRVAMQYSPDCAIPYVAMVDAGTVELVRGLGVEIVEVTLPDLAQINALSNIIIGAEASACHATWMRERPQDYSPQTRARLELGFHHAATRYIEALDLRGPLLDAFGEALFAKADALMTPVLRMPVPTIAETDVADSSQMLPIMAKITHGTRPINYLGLPALSLPAGFTGEGMPFGIQLVGRPFAEAMLFRLGAAFERETGWGRRAPAVAQAAA